MARSIITQKGAELVIYFAADEFSCVDIAHSLQNRFPSLEPVGWDDFADRRMQAQADRENTAILENTRCVIFYTEYCSMGALSVCRLSDYTDGQFTQYSGLDSHWIRSARRSIEEAVGRAARVIKPFFHFDNGEVWYTR